MQLIVLVLFSLLANIAFAAEKEQPHPNERDYIIEVLAFAQKPSAMATELPGRPHTYLPLETPALKIGPSPAWSQLNYLDGPAYQAQNVKLVREAAALNRSQDYRLLFHQAWRMRLVSEANSLPLLIEGGDYFDGAPELQGKLMLSVARYLHLETDLYLNTFEPLSEEIKSSVDPLLKTNFQIKDSAGMHQHRRMRSNELHFIDSPYLGLLIKIERAP